jgi:DNA-binding IclR family transcriptional regulator
VVAAAFALLGALEAEGGKAGLTALARRSGLPNATAHRLLGQLIAVGAVERRARRYALGSVLHRLGSGWEPWRGLREAARVPLQAIARSGAELILAAITDERLMVVERASGVLTGPMPELQATAGQLARGVPPSGVAVVPGAPDAHHSCVAAAVPGGIGETLLVVAALLSHDGPAERLAGPVARAAASIACGAR